MTATVLWIDDVSRTDVRRVGGKASSLGEIQQAGCRVPPAFVVPCEHSRRSRIHALSPSFKSDVRLACDRIGAKSYAVRSSAVVEDGATESWAGQFNTYLGVKADDVVARVFDCWLSPGSEHATAYARHQGALERRWDLAVIVQAMVASEISGVLFTRDPVSRAEDTCALEAIAGLGELLVQGMVTPASYVIERSSQRVLEHRDHQQTKVAQLTNTGIQHADLPPDYLLPLTEQVIAEVVRLGLRLEQRFGAPQDVEWTYANGLVYILQSRPITTSLTALVP